MSKYKTGQPLQYRRSLVIGFGFVIEFAGKQQHSVAWPDGPAARYMEDELPELGIRCNPFEGVDQTTTKPESKSDPALEEIVDPTEVESDTETVLESDTSNEEASAATDESSEATFVHDQGATEAANIRNYLSANPEASNQDVIAGLHEHGLEVASNQVTRARKQLER